MVLCLPMSRKAKKNVCKYPNLKLYVVPAHELYGEKMC
jgi:hypothetical protein